MSNEQDSRAKDGEDPKVFRVAKLPAAGAPDMDLRTFVKTTITAVGAGATMGMLSGCEGDDEDHPYVKGDPEEPPGMPGQVQEGETGSNIQSESGQTRVMPCGSEIPAGWTCTCNCVSVPVTSCSCDGHSNTLVYWYPN